MSYNLSLIIPLIHIPSILLFTELEPELKLLVKVQRVHADKSRVLLGVRGVPEPGHAEEAYTIPLGKENLLLIGAVTIIDEAVEEHECLECHHPVTGLVKALSDHSNAGAHHGTREGCEADDLTHVALMRRVLLVSSGVDDGYFEV